MYLLSASVDAVPEDDLSLRVGQVPDARGAVARPGGEQVLHRVPRADEDLLVVALEHARLLLRDLHPLVDRQLKWVEYIWSRTNFMQSTGRLSSSVSGMR